MSPPCTTAASFVPSDEEVMEFQFSTGAVEVAQVAPLLLIFNSCGVGMGCKSLIFQDSRVGFRKNVVPRHGAY